jgi:hypothetical protein
MQLKPKAGAGNLRAGLMAATCALLAPAVKAQGAGGETDSTRVDSGLLLYQEDKGRIQSLDAIVKLSHDFGDEHVLTATGSVDVLTGGSPNGAVAQKTVQTFTTPSGRAGGSGHEDEDEDEEDEDEDEDEDEGSTTYRVAPGDQPLDPNFRDLRVAGDLNWSQPLGIGNRIAANGHVSVEHDFQSASTSLLFSRDFNSKNTTLGVGVSGEFDRIKPLGKVPIGGSDYALDQTGKRVETKSVLGAQLGLTQVLARNWIAQLNLSVERSRGYLNDPYKIVSHVDATGVASQYLFENRPDNRERRSVWLGNKVALGSSVLDVSLRYGTDDWGVDSQTLEARYRLRVGGSMYLEPHLRWYRQDAADFYRLYLTDAESAMAFKSADPRLGAFTAGTVGLKLGMPRPGGSEIAVRLEGYQQDPQHRSSDLPGLSGLDLNPKLRAVMLQLDWNFGF